MKLKSKTEGSKNPRTHSVERGKGRGKDRDEDKRRGVSECEG
jgi:hypothetical protein